MKTKFKSSRKMLLAAILCSLSITCTTRETASQSDSTIGLPVRGGEDQRRIHKWLPGEGKAPSVSQDMDKFLESLSGSFRLLYCKYDKAQLVYSHPLQSDAPAIEGFEWHTLISTSPVKSDPTAMDLSIKVQLKAGKANQVGIAAAFDFKDWSTENYVMLPASVYNGNRCKIVDRGYAQGLDRHYLYQKDIPLMSVPIPQLSLFQDSVSRLEVNASNMATPAMCFYSKEKKKGFILLATQKTQYADNGFIVEESADRQTASFVVSAPGVREKLPLFVGFAESKDRGADLREGDEIELQMRIHVFEASDGIPEILEKFMEVRKNITGPNHPRNLIPFSQVALWMTERIDSRWYEGDESEFYCPENANWISFGWIGGLMNTYPMIALGDDFHLKRVIKTFDFAIPRAQGESGYYCGTLNYDGSFGFRESYPEFPEIVLTRKNADVLYWMIKQFYLLKSQDKSQYIRSDWEMSMQRLADAFVRTWKKQGQWGRMVNNITGDVAEFVSSGGVMAIGGLALAAEYYKNPEYLKVAKEAADYYYEKEFVSMGMTTGGCADILHNADSESAAGFMTSLITLYEMTGERKWLEKSIQLLYLVATWTTSYDYELPQDTELGKLGAKLAGIYWASTQNKHGAPGICTSSGDPLFKIYRATGNRLYGDLMNDIVHAHGESIRPGGFTNERLTYCDAESRGERGTHVTGWNELNGFLMALEIPGIYVQTDGDLFYVFDHVEAEIEERNKDGLTLKMKNPTPFDAEVSILAESTQQTDQPLGINAFINWPRHLVKAGDTERIRISPEGKISQLQ